jgi:hypothetical protein
MRKSESEGYLVEHTHTPFMTLEDHTIRQRVRMQIRGETCAEIGEVIQHAPNQVEITGLELLQHSSDEDTTDYSFDSYGADSFQLAARKLENGTHSQLHHTAEARPISMYGSSIGSITIDSIHQRPSAQRRLSSSCSEFGNDSMDLARQTGPIKPGNNAQMELKNNAQAELKLLDAKMNSFSREVYQTQFINTGGVGRAA